MRVRISLGSYDIALRPGESLIGRTRACHLRVDDPTVSRRHARLLVVRDVCTIADLGSRNGVKINGEKIHDARPLSDGDVVAVGACVFTVHVDHDVHDAEESDQLEVEDITQLPNELEYQIPIYRTCIRCRGMLKKGEAVCPHCTAEQDHIYVVNRRNITDEEKETSISAPSIIKFDMEGNVVGSWGDQTTVPNSIHGCFVDGDKNVYVAGNSDGIVQKYAPDGKLLLQIGSKGKFDSVDGTRRGKGNNTAQDQLHMPSGIVVDPGNGDIYISDGYGNRRVAVFDKAGKFLRQWGRQATDEETQRGVPGVFASSRSPTFTST